MAEIKDLTSFPTHVSGQIVNEGLVRAIHIKALLPPDDDRQYRKTARTYAPALSMDFENIARFIEGKGFPARREQTDSFVEDVNWKDKDWDVVEDESGILAWHIRGGILEIFEGITVKHEQLQLEPTPLGETQTVQMAPDLAIDQASQVAQDAWNNTEPQVISSTVGQASQIAQDARNRFIINDPNLKK